MKNTKIMLMVLLTFLLTWSLLSFISSLLLDISFRESYLAPGVLFALILFGWIPSVIVLIDLNED